MSLRFVLGKSGSGKTGFCLTEALTNKGKSIVIVPEQYSFTAEKLLAGQASVYGFGLIDVFSFKRFAQRILPVSSGAALRRLNRSGKSILIQKILIDNSDRLTVLKKAAEESGTAVDMAKLFGEFKRYNISAEGLQAAAEELKIDKLREISLIYSEYQRYIRDSYIDSDDDLLTLSEQLLSSDYLLNTNVYIDSFEGFTPSEFLCLSAMLQKADRVSVSLCLDPCCLGRSEFYPVERTYEKIQKLAKSKSVKIDEPVIFTEDKTKRSHEIKHLMCEYFNYPARVFEEKTDNLKIFASKNPYEEIHFVARTILKLCRENDYKFRDIAVTGRSLDKYEKYIKTIFKEYGINCYLDRKRSLLSHPLTVFLLSALEILINGYQYSSVFKLVKSGFLHINRENADILENYILATGLKGPVWRDSENWKIRTKIYSEKEEPDPDELNELQTADKTRRLIVEPIEALRQEMIYGKTAREKCAALYQFMVRHNIKRRLRAYIRLFEKKSDKMLSAEYSGIYNDLMNALEDICSAFGDERISIKSFYDILKSGLGAYEAGIIPATLDGVSVGNIDRIKGYRVKALFLIGVTDGVFPAPPKSDGLITDDDRMKLSEMNVETAPRGTEKILDEDFLIYKAFSLAENYIFFSYPLSEMDGSSLRPSLIIERLKTVFPNIRAEDDILGIPDCDKISSPKVTLGYVLTGLRRGELSGELFSAYSWFCQKDKAFRPGISQILRSRNKAQPITTEIREQLIGRELYTSVSRLERFSACPFSYFIQYTLGAKERRVLKMMPTDAGSFLHNFIDEFSKRLRVNGKTWKTVDEEYIDREINEISASFYKRLNAYVFDNSCRFAHSLNRLKRMVKVSLTMISNHIKIGKFEPLGYELSFGDDGEIKPLELTLPNGASVKLTGKIDRADSFYSEKDKATFVRIIDYKSGTKDFNIIDVFYGLNLQLSVYLTALCEDESLKKPVKPAGILYFMLDDPVSPGDFGFGPDDAEKARSKALKLKGLVLNDVDIVKSMDENIEVSSDYLPVRMTGEGIRGGGDETRFQILTKYAKKAAYELSNELLMGITDINPYQFKDKTPCEYCKYRTICKFNGRYSRNLESISEDEVWLRMEESVKDGN